MTQPQSQPNDDRRTESNGTRDPSQLAPPYRDTDLRFLKFLGRDGLPLDVLILMSIGFFCLSISLAFFVLGFVLLAPVFLLGTWGVIGVVYLSLRRTGRLEKWSERRGRKSEVKALRKATPFTRADVMEARFDAYQRSVGRSPQRQDGRGVLHRFAPRLSHLRSQDENESETASANRSRDGSRSWGRSESKGERSAAAGTRDSDPERVGPDPATGDAAESTADDDRNRGAYYYE